MQNAGHKKPSTAIYAELKRRNVFRIALLYVVSASFILETTHIGFEIWGLADWVFRFNLTLLSICFPAVLIFAWVCELTPQGVKREKNVRPGESITVQTGHKLNRITLVLFVLSILALTLDQLLPRFVSKQDSANIMEISAINLQGHRGARGLLPENTIPAFLYALDLGVTTLELDVAVNAQGHVVVSHDPWMSAKICTHADGRSITEEEEKNLRIYAMSDDDINAFDCGGRGHPDFASQTAMSVTKPLLGAVFEAVASRESETNRSPVLFNIEIKSRPEGDGVFHPEVKEFASILYLLIKKYGLLERTSIQSFDPRALEAMHDIDPGVSIVLLVDNQDGLERNLARLSFKPHIYSPQYQLLHETQIQSAHARNIQVIPWTVNDESAMKRLLNIGVDGFITDYPDIGIGVITEFTQAQ